MKKAFESVRDCVIDTCPCCGDEEEQPQPTAQFPAPRQNGGPGNRRTGSRSTPPPAGRRAAQNSTTANTNQPVSFEDVLFSDQPPESPPNVNHADFGAGTENSLENFSARAKANGTNVEMPRFPWENAPLLKKDEVAHSPRSILRVLNIFFKRLHCQKQFSIGASHHFNFLNVTIRFINFH